MHGTEHRGRERDRKKREVFISVIHWNWRRGVGYTCTAGRPHACMRASSCSTASPARSYHTGIHTMDMHMIRWSMEVMVQGSRRRSTRHAVSPAISQADVLLWTADWTCMHGRSEIIQPSSSIGEKLLPRIFFGTVHASSYAVVS